MEILLKNKEMVTFGGDRSGLRLCCIGGGLWITQQGDSRDHILRAGQSFESRLAGEIVVTSLASSRVTMPHSGTPPAVYSTWSLRPVSG